jgi:hypothetical protein
MSETHAERGGRRWSIRVVDAKEAEQADFEFWFQRTPAERVAAVEECLLSALKTRGIDEIPRLRRVCRVVERTRG